VTAAVVVGFGGKVVLAATVVVGFVVSLFVVPVMFVA
jgi:hypothetical protein